MKDWEADERENMVGALLGCAAAFLVPLATIIAFFLAGWLRALIVAIASIVTYFAAGFFLVRRSMPAYEAREKRLASMPQGQEERDQQEVKQYLEAMKAHKEWRDDADTLSGAKPRAPEAVRPGGPSDGSYAVMTILGTIVIFLVLVLPTACQSDFDKCVREWRNVGMDSGPARAKCMDEHRAP